MDVWNKLLCVNLLILVGECYVAGLAVEETTEYLCVRIVKEIRSKWPGKKDINIDLTTKVKYMKEQFQFTWRGKQKKMSLYYGLGFSLRWQFSERDDYEILEYDGKIVHTFLNFEWKEYTLIYLCMQQTFIEHLLFQIVLLPQW